MSINEILMEEDLCQEWSINEVLLEEEKWKRTNIVLIGCPGEGHYEKIIDNTENLYKNEVINNINNFPAINTVTINYTNDLCQEWSINEVLLEEENWKRRNLKLKQRLQEENLKRRIVVLRLMDDILTKSA